jgi:hypothetical protein
VIHRDIKIASELERVMPGASWERWRPTYMTKGVTAPLAKEIAEYLENSVTADQDRISTQKLKEAMGKTEKDGVVARTWTKAVQRFLDGQELPEWSLQGRSLVRAGAAFRE